ncbi:MULTISPECIES: hypothetical protein [Sphingomonas]|uniref:hypothetical protein n=1 Tax=Sphingomonas TaxID=13687 RepID=UPI0012ECD8A2|nr:MULTISPECIES: hypothetical protein [Sphingomonas]
MGKAVGIVAGVVAMGFATAATFGAGAVVLGLTAAQVGSIAAGAAMVASVGGALLAEKPPAATGAVNQILIGANQPRPYLIGQTYYGGNRIHQEGFGGKVSKVNNPYLLLVDVYSGAGPIAGFVMPYLDFVPVVLNGAAATGYAANHLYVYHQTGRTPEPQALSTHWGGAQGWSAQHKLSSFAAIAWCLRFDEDGKRFAAGVPQTGGEWRGVLAYDPRKDSTYPGGSGPHRWADPADKASFAAAKATWEWTRCPGLHGLRYALGTWERDESKPDAVYRKTFGIGIPIDGIRVADFVALANVCDANGWHVDGVIVEPAKRDDNLKNILAAGGAERCWVGGKLGLKLSAPRVPLDTITEYDLANDEVEIGAMQGWEARLNTIVPKYRSRDHKWEYVPSEAVTIASYLAEDGEEKSEERQYNLVQSKDQAAQLAAYELLDARELGEIVLTCKPRLRRYGAGDLLIVHLPDDGLVQQPCVVLKRTVDPVAMTVEFVLRGETAAKHDFALGRTGTAPATPRLTSGQALDEVAVDVPLPWSAIVDNDGKKPEDNATVGAPDWTKVGDRPVPNVLATLDAVEPIVEKYPKLEKQVSAIEEAQVGTDAALYALDRATADQAAAIAQADRDAGRIGDTLLRLLAESERTRAILRDAGIVVDPSTGIVRIYAVDQLAERTARAEIVLNAATASITQKASVDYVNQQIALAVLDPVQAAQLEPIIARLTSAEQTISGLTASVSTKAEVLELTRVSGRVTVVQSDLDALAGTVSQKASRTDVDAQGVRIGVVEAALSSLPDVSSFGITVRQARAVADDAAEAGLRALLAGDEANRRQIVQQAEVRSELIAKLVDQSGAEAAARQLLSVQIGAVDARSVQESIARIAGDKALTVRIDAQASVSDELAAAISTLRETAIEARKGIAGITTTVRQQAADDDTTAEALLRALIAGDVTGRARATQLAQVQQELTTTLIANESSAAVARQALTVRMASTEAAIVATSRALADLTQSLVDRIAAAEAVVRDPVTGLAATRAQLSEVDRLRSEGDAANAQSTATLSAQVNHATTGLPATRAEQIVDRKARADGDAANAGAIDALSAQVNDQTTGLPATRAQIVSDRTASADRDEALGRRVDTVSASIGDTNAAVAVLGEAMVDGDEANARLIEQVSLKLGTDVATVQDLIEIVKTATDEIRATKTIAIDINGNVVGQQLIGSPDGPGALALINADLRMGTGRVVFDNGSVMRVQGTGFGKNGDLVTWFGPSMSIAACTRANAISYEATNGDAYFGGTLSAGTIKNAVRTTSPYTDTLSTGDIGSNGDKRTIVLSFAYSRRSASGSNQAGSGASSAVVALYRRGVEIGRLEATGGYLTSLNDGVGPTERYLYSEEVGGSITVTDQTGGSSVEYNARVLSRSFGPGPHATGGISFDIIAGSMAIIETEE